MERWLPPRAFVLGVYLSALILGPSFFLVFAYLVFFPRWCSYICLRPDVGACGVSLLCFGALASCWCLCRGGGVLRRVVMYAAVSVSSLLLSFALKKAREVLPCAMHACFSSSLSRPLASCLLLFFMLCLFVFSARARAATASPRFRPYIFLRRSLAVSRPPAILALLLSPGLALVIPNMADAPAPAAPRQQRRKEARAQAQDDNRRVRQRIDDLEARLETLEGRQRGHDLRLQYLEAPLKLVLKKFRAPVEFWASKDAGFHAAKSAFSAAFMQELREVGGATIQHLLEEAEPKKLNYCGVGTLQVIIGIFRTGWFFSGSRRDNYSRCSASFASW